MKEPEQEAEKYGSELHMNDSVITPERLSICHMDSGTHSEGSHSALWFRFVSVGQMSLYGFEFSCVCWL